MLSTVVELSLFDLVQRSDETVVPLDPTHGLDALVAAANARTHHAVRTTGAHFHRYSRTMQSPGPEPQVQVLQHDEVISIVADIEAGARNHVKVFDTPPYRNKSFDNPMEMRSLQQGVVYRVIYAREAITDPGRYEGNVLPCVQAGESARVMADVPAKMMLVDDQIAVVSLTVRDVDDHHTALLVRHPSLIRLLRSTFEMCWSIATPVKARAEDLGQELGPDEHSILQYLAVGATDEAIARNLRVSRRTVVRHVARLMERAGAQSRFQLAVQAGVRGWLPSTRP